MGVALHNCENRAPLIQTKLATYVHKLKVGKEILFLLINECQYVLYRTLIVLLLNVIGSFLTKNR